MIIEIDDNVLFGKVEDSLIKQRPQPARQEAIVCNDVHKRAPFAACYEEAKW
ncbi:Hypothetical protein ABZS17G119_03540 [Kosakonia cowanii]